MSYWSVWPKLYTLTQLSRASPTDYPDQLQLIDLRRANLSGGISLVPTDTSLVDQWYRSRKIHRRRLAIKSEEILEVEEEFLFLWKIDNFS